MILHLLTLLMLNLFPPTSVYDFTIKTIDGIEINLSQFKGKKMLIVNVASECGYTPQYESLQKLYEKYKNELVVIAFPANNFGHQEPGTDSEIKMFCSQKYNVTFPMMSKVSVNGEDIHPLFKWLIAQENPDFTGAIKWNFEKFLLDEKGNLLHRYRSKTDPLSDELVNTMKEKSH